MRRTRAGIYDESGVLEERAKMVAEGYAKGEREFVETMELPPNATPLDVMVMAMRRAYLIGGSMAAAPYAEKAAPYLHPKITSIELKNSGSGGEGGDSSSAIPFRVEFVKPGGQG